MLGAFAAQAAVVAGAAAARPRRPPRPSRSPRPTGCAPRCSPRSATTCAPRWPSAKAAVTSLRSDDVDLDRRGPRRAARHRRRVARPARPARRQPARHEPAAGRRAVGRRRSRSALDEVVPLRPRRPRRRRRPTSSSTLPDDAARGAGRPRAARAGGREPARRTRCATRPPATPPLLTGERARRPRRAAGRRPRAGHPAGRPGPDVRCRSSGSATPTTPPASGSASPWPAGSPRRWAARSSPRRPPAAG